MAELWLFNVFHDGGILNLPQVSIFSIWSSLDSGWGCSCKISCLYVNEYMAELLSFVKKNKMAAAAILNCYFVTVDHPRSLLHGPNIVLKFHVNRITTA